MKDFDPRPMPPQVLASYRDPLILEGLLESYAFDGHVESVVRTFLHSLVKNHGNVEVAVGKRTFPASELQVIFKNHVHSMICLLLDVEEYSERDSVYTELAAAMQPFWADWFESSVPLHGEDRWAHTLSLVLGDRQLRWLACQYARSALVTMSSVYPQKDVVETGLRCIEASEDYASFGGDERLLHMSRMRMRAYDRQRRDALADGSSERDRLFLSAAWHAAKPPSKYAFGISLPMNIASESVGEAFLPMNANFLADRDSHFYKLVEMTKRLISPTLITSPSGGNR